VLAELLYVVEDRRRGLSHRLGHLVERLRQGECVDLGTRDANLLAVVEDDDEGVLGVGHLLGLGSVRIQTLLGLEVLDGLLLAVPEAQGGLVVLRRRDQLYILGRLRAVLGRDRGWLTASAASSLSRVDRVWDARGVAGAGGLASLGGGVSGRLAAVDRGARGRGGGREL
jgi:hypothetical protein